MSLGKLDDLLSKTGMHNKPEDLGVGLSISGPFLTQLELLFIRSRETFKSKRKLNTSCSCGTDGS